MEITNIYHLKTDRGQPYVKLTIFTYMDWPHIYVYVRKIMKSISASIGLRRNAPKTIIRRELN